MKKVESWKSISLIGKRIKQSWKEIAKSNSIKIDIKGIDALPIFYFKSENHNAYKTFISQEMLKKIFYHLMLFTPLYLIKSKRSTNT